MKQEILEHLGIDDQTLEKLKSLAEVDNPFTKPKVIPKYEVVIDDRISLEQLNTTLQPIFNQLTLANGRIEELITEKAVLITEVDNLKVKEKELEDALDISFQMLMEKEEIITDQAGIIDELSQKLSKKWWKFWG